MATKKSDKQLWIMLALIAAILAAILLLPSCGGRTTRGTAAETADETAATTLVGVGAAAPDFTVELFDGGELTLSSLRGKVVLLNFWATWCPPCREELSHVQAEILDRFAGKDFVMLPVSRGERRETVERFIDKTGYTFPVGLDADQSIFRKYATNYIPRNFLIGADGRVIYVSVGYDEADFGEMIRKIDEALK